MTEHDLLEVVEIEESAGLSPWGWEAYHRELASATDVIMVVARIGASLDRDKRIAGFIVARLIGDELHINNIGVRRPLRRSGIGARLLEHALSWAGGKGAKRALLEVRAGNEAAQALYRKCGFEVAGRRRRYYRTPTEDALIMNLSFQ
jgi:ribosomal-protein-alanine N-acetyltransferase